MTFTAKTIRPLGDFDEKYGQRYWGSVHDSEMAVAFNLMNPVDIPEGATLEFEERTIKETGPQSKNPGTEYLFLKKVKVEGGQLAVTTPKATNDELILQKLDEILSRLPEAPSGYEKAKAVREQLPQKELDTVVEDIGDEPIDISQIPF